MSHFDTQKIGMCCACGGAWSPAKTVMVGGIEYGPCCAPEPPVGKGKKAGAKAAKSSAVSKG